MYSRVPIGISSSQQIEHGILHINISISQSLNPNPTQTPKSQNSDSTSQSPPLFSLLEKTKYLSIYQKSNKAWRNPLPSPSIRPPFPAPSKKNSFPKETPPPPPRSPSQKNNIPTLYFLLRTPYSLFWFLGSLALFLPRLLAIKPICPYQAHKYRIGT